MRLSSTGWFSIENRQDLFAVEVDDPWGMWWWLRW